MRVRPSATGDGWTPPTTHELLRFRPVKRLLEPLTERQFTYGSYVRFLDRVVESGAASVLHRDLERSPRDRAVIAMRHDVDSDLDHALTFAELEHTRGVKATYFVLHTARYYATTKRGAIQRRESVLPSLRRLQELGHEVGWHNDLVTLQLVYGIDPVSYLESELRWLRENGIAITGSAAHGSRWCHELGYHNNDFFVDWPESTPGRRRVETVSVRNSDVSLAHGSLAQFDLTYEAYHLEIDEYFSDARFDASGARWHPDRFDVEAVAAGSRVVVLTHPCIWGRGILSKYARFPERALQRVRRDR